MGDQLWVILLVISNQSRPLIWPITITYYILPTGYSTIILRNRAEYQGIFRKIKQDNWFIIQQVLIDFHFQKKKNHSSMIKALNTKAKLQQIEVYYRSLKKVHLQTHVWK